MMTALGHEVASHLSANAVDHRHLEGISWQRIDKLAFDGDPSEWSVPEVLALAKGLGIHPSVLLDAVGWGHEAYEWRAKLGLTDDQVDDQADERTSTAANAHG